MIQVLHFPDFMSADHEVLHYRSLAAMLAEHYPDPSATLKVFHQHYAETNEIDLDSEEGWASVAEMPGPFIVVNVPAGIEMSTLAIIQAVIAVASIAASIIFAPSPPVATQRNIQKESPNNGLSNRTNRERVNGRIPDIFGTVRSTPDLLSVPYFEFENHVEKEIAYMCVGRGAYDIPVAEIRDATTAAQEIAGMSVEIYGPYTSPNNGAAPQLRIGNAISRAVLRTQRLDAVNGQVLQPLNAASVTDSRMVFTSPNIITSQDPELDFTDLFLAGDVVQLRKAIQYDGTFYYTIPDGEGQARMVSLNDGEIALLGNRTADWSAGQSIRLEGARFLYTVSGGGDGGSDTPVTAVLDGVYNIAQVSQSGGYTRLRLTDAIIINQSWRGVNGSNSGPAVGAGLLSRPSGMIQFDLNGEYTINTLTSNTITLNSPASVNNGWNTLANQYGGQSSVIFADINTNGERFEGWFTLSAIEPIDRLISNFVALSGLYADNGKQQYKRNVTVRLEAAPVDAAGNNTGPIQVLEGAVEGSATSRATRALTMRFMLAGSSRRWKVRARRVTPEDKDFNGSVVDEIKWRDLYGAAAVSQGEFGNITTAQVLTLATDGALAVKDRKFNLLVTRRLPRWQGGNSFSSDLYATRNAADILSFLALDPHVGNRSLDEVDFTNLYQTVQDIIAYFGFDAAGEFSYTFDDNNLSFEETVSAIAAAINCTAYRQGSKLRLYFERLNENSSLLFNHRNKIPGSETRTVEFGTKAEGYDGLEYQWINPEDDGAVTLYIPPDRSSVNPKVIESIGVRHPAQAHVNAHRAWNKIVYQHTSAEFLALPEASPLILTNRISVADNTRSGSMDGEIVGVSGMEVKLSQPMPWSASTVMEVQSDDGQTEIIPVTRGSSDRHALLSRAPRTPINVDPGDYVRTLFAMATAERRPEPFLVTEKGERDDQGCIPITAINYDARYYQNDFDYRA
ncbi:host specificity factor TipJ family phage tail protein [Alcaligenaceae bacterium B3P038]|nr:host specificity factor TipJ family phage tail protein [Alcaligenaceae bacterium B3P038]